MKHALGNMSAIAIAIALQAIAQDAPEAQNSAAATQATGYTPDADTGPEGSGARRAARGAAASAAAGAAQNNQHDGGDHSLQSLPSTARGWLLAGVGGNA